MADSAEVHELPSNRLFATGLPRNEFPAHGMPARDAFELIHLGLRVDGQPSMNLASFVTTWMEPEAEILIHEAISTNHIDHEEYPLADRIEEICVRMLADLWHAPDIHDAVGVATIGSSEAIMLGLLAHKFSWRKRREDAGLSADKPNVVFGAETHVVWDKFARYFDVEMRKIPMRADHYVLHPDDVAENIDENTIAVGAVLGTTFIGENDPIEEINDLLVKVKKEKGWDIPLHVDGASGGFIAPFSNPDELWDFRLEQVASINASGHKYGLVYPGVGWLVFRDRTKLPEELVFNVNYLGGAQPTFTFNFSRGQRDDPGAVLQLRSARIQRLQGHRREHAQERQASECRARKDRSLRGPEPGMLRASRHVPAEAGAGFRRVPPVRPIAAARLDRSCLYAPSQRGTRHGAPRRSAQRHEPRQD